MSVFDNYIPTDLSKIRNEIKENLKIRDDVQYEDNKPPASIYAGCVGSCTTNCSGSCTSECSGCVGCSSTCESSCSATSESITGVSHYEYKQELINNFIDKKEEIVYRPTINGVPYDENPKEGIIKRLLKFISIYN